MRVDFKSDIKNGHWITFEKEMPNGKHVRKFYKIIGYECVTYFCEDYHDKNFGNDKVAKGIATVKNPRPEDGDEIYTDFQDIKDAYPEEFL